MLNTISRNWHRKEHETEKCRIETIESLESTKTQTKLTRSGISLKNFTPTCFFCDKDDNDSNMKLHMRQTFQVQQKIEEIALDIGDKKGLAKLSADDMIAIETKYHCKCLTAYYNKVRNNHPLTCNRKMR